MMVSRLWPMCGHDRVIALLSQELAKGSLRHAYLVSGPRHAGKSTLATVFAQAIVCPQRTPGGPACGACDSCRRVERTIHPDVQTFSLESQRQHARERSSVDRLSVETAREISAAAAFRPFTARHRVIIVDDAETLTGIAQEALLKTIEEPPLQLVLLLLTESGDALKPTIRSRCEQINLMPVPAEIIEQCLLDRGVERTLALTLSRQAMGLPGRAIEMARDPSILEGLQERIARAADWIAASSFDRVCRSFELANAFGKDRVHVFLELEAVSELWRGVMMSSAGVESPDNTMLSEKAGNQSFGQFELSDSLRALESVVSCMSDLESNVRPRLALEAMVMQWPTNTMEFSR
jgi:DNA polymerase-3 subunit delta'